MQFWRFDTQKFVAMHLDDQILSCVYLTGKYPDVQIAGYQKFELGSKIVHDLVLDNPTSLKNYIASFIKKYHLDIIPCGLILAGPTILEILNHQSSDHLVSSSLAEHKFSRFYINSSNHGISSESAQNWSYCAHIPIGIVLQYQLVFIQQRLNLTGVTSHNGALLGLVELADFKATSNLKQLVVCENTEFKFGADFNLAEQQILWACLGLYVSWRIA